MKNPCYAILYRIGYAINTGGNHWQPDRGCFNDYHTKTFAVAWQTQHIGCGHIILGVIGKPDPMYPIWKTLRKRSKPYFKPIFIRPYNQQMKICIFLAAFAKARNKSSSPLSRLSLPRNK